MGAAEQISDEVNADVAYSLKDRKSAVELASQVGINRAGELLAIPKMQILAWSQAAGLTNTGSKRASSLVAARAAMLEGLEYRKVIYASMLMGDAERLREQLWESAVVHHFNKDGEFSTGELAEPTFRDKQAIMTSIAIIVDKVQLLTGAATARVENLGEVSREQALEALDDLKSRRSKLDKAA